MDEMGIEELKRYYIKDYDEILGKIDKRIKSIETPPPPKRFRKRIGWLKNTYLKRIDTTYNILVSEIDRVVEALTFLSKQHVFYKELFHVWTNYYPEQVRKHFIFRKRILGRIYTEYKTMVKNAVEEYELKRYYRTCIGRMLSVVKRRRKLLKKVKEALIELRKLPSIRDDELKVIVAGMPQVGKSTLVSKLSTAEPEIASYPFTTKTIIVGHLIKEPYYRIAFIDTPGLLDRPLEERNEIEIKAVLALKHLADKIIYLVDPSPNSYYTIDEQLHVLDDVKSIVGEEVIVCLNKVDITPPSRVEGVKKIIREKHYRVEVLEISAKTGYGLEKLLEILTKTITNKLP